MPSVSPRLTGRFTFAAVLTGSIILTGCGSTSTASTSAATTSTQAAAVATSGSTAASSSVTISDAWVKATAGTEDPTMTAAFGVLHNTTGTDLTVVSATNTATSKTELHEMAMVDGAMVMRAVAGGIPVPANGTTSLDPGGLHVMILDATRPISPGDEVGVTLTMSDGSTLQFQALAKEFSGANEEYGEMTGEMMTSGTEMTGDSTSMEMTDGAGLDSTTSTTS